MLPLVLIGSALPKPDVQHLVKMSFFDGIEQGKPIEVFLMNNLYNAEQSDKKVNLTIGAYRTEEGKPWVLPVVREAEKRLAADESLNHEYLPVLGLKAFTDAASKLLLGDNSPSLKEQRVIGAQALSGTGSLRAGAEFLSKLCGFTTVYVSKPTWGNHKMVFSSAGFKDVKEYTYWDAPTRTVNIDQYVADLEAAPERSVVVMHGCAHNPTGMDPSKDQWKRIAEVIKKKRHFPFFDIAYQGFASGDPDADAWAIRYFDEQGMEMMVAQSFAKNFGLYNERVGNITIVVDKKDDKKINAMKSQMELIIRANWSNPPSHGARIVAMILNDDALRAQWFECIKIMSSRIKEMRAALQGHLERLGTPGKWDHITKQIGLFSYTGLTQPQFEVMYKEHKIFLLSDGRINICGLNTKNVEYVAQAIDKTVRGEKSNI